MTKNDLWDIWEKMKEKLGPEEFLSELFEAMSADEAEENLQHINDMHDFGLMED